MRVPLLFLCGLPLLIYPFVLLANAMSAAGEGKGPGFAFGCFLIGSTAYPVVYIPCLVLSIQKAKKGEEQAALNYATGPFGYLIVLAGVFVIAMNN